MKSKKVENIRVHYIEKRSASFHEFFSFSDMSVACMDIACCMHSFGHYKGQRYFCYVQSVMFESPGSIPGCMRSAHSGQPKNGIPMAIPLDRTSAGMFWNTQDSIKTGVPKTWT